MDANKAIILISTIAIYKAIRFISSSLHTSHPVVVDSCDNDDIPNSTVSNSSHDISVAPPASKYDVFLSFRGEDTRDNFTSHLYEALCKANIQTFMDLKLHKGEQISSILLKTIEESRISVIIFSKDYAFSTWCLDELVKIMECNDRYGRVVIPIFYNIDPSNVRKQSGSYRDAFLKLKKRFEHNKEKMQMWKDAMIQSTSLSGWDSKNIRPESKLIKMIVKDIWNKLNKLSSSHFDGLVGIDHHIEKIEELLFESRIIGIWGMGGIGKTTLAKVIFHKLKAQFESFSFIESVREKVAKIGLDKLHEECLKELLQDNDIDVCDMKFTSMKSRLQHKKIFLVLDDVDNLISVEDLTKVCDWFGDDSRIIITSRDKQVLKNAFASTLYHVQELDIPNAIHLFSLKAFKQKVPYKSYMELSNWILGYCEGNPLALIVLGCFLYGRGKEEWESTLEKLNKAPHKDIFNVLKLSFDGLDDLQKNIFLDLAYLSRETFCLSLDFIRNFYGSSAYIEISVLKDKCLISVNEIDGIKMHNLVRRMGFEICRQQLILDPQKPVRLWRHEDIYQIFNNNEGTETIQYISLDTCKTKRIILMASVFQKMYNLRFLKFYKSNSREPSNVYIFEGLDNLPEELRFLFWEEYPLSYVPLDFCAENLVKFSMPNSHLRQLWDGNQCFPNLQSINLSGSKHLIELPNLSQAPNIQEILLNGCVNLAQIHSSNVLCKLWNLQIYGCEKLRHVKVGGKIKGRRSRFVVVYKILDLKNFSCKKVNVKLFVTNNDNIFSGFRIKVMSISFTEILECMDSMESAKFKLLTQSLASLLPFVSRLHWTDTRYTFRNSKKHFDYYFSYDEKNMYEQLKVISSGLLFKPRESSNALEPLQRARTTSRELEVRVVKEVVVETRKCTNKEERRSLELEKKLMTKVKCYGSSGNTLTRIPYSIACWSLLTKLSLQKSDIIGRAAWSIPELSIMKSLDEADCTRFQLALHITFAETEVGTKKLMFFGIPNLEHDHSFIRFKGSRFLFGYLARQGRKRG